MKRNCIWQWSGDAAHALLNATPFGIYNTKSTHGFSF